MTTLRQEMHKTLTIAWPVITGLVGQMLFNLIDTSMMGRYSTTSLAAATFVTSVLTIPLVYVFGFSSCIAVLASQAIGRKNPTAVERVFRTGLILIFIQSVAFFFVSFFARDHLALFGQPADVTSEAKTFFILMALSLVPFSLFQGMRQLSDSLEKTLPPTLVNFAALLINVLINYAFIYGNWGAPELGLTGAGIGTLVARTSMVPMMYWVIKRKAVYRPYWGHLKKFRPNLTDIRSAFRVGFPSSLQYVFETSIFAGSAILMGWFGKEELAGHQIAINHASVTFMIALGLSAATTIRIGRATGENDWHSVRRIGLTSMGLAMVIMGLFALFFIAARDFLPTLYVDDLKVIHIASDLFICMAFFQLFDAAQGVLVGALRGTSDVKIPTLVTFFSYWIVGGALTYSLGFIFGLRHVGIWVGLGIALFVASAFLLFRFLWLTKNQIRKY